MIKTYLTIILSFLILTTSAISFAVDSPVLYTRANILVKRASLPAIQEVAPEGQAVPTQTQLALNVEVRDAAVLYRQQGWYNLSSPSEKGGVLFVFAEPTRAPISPSSQYVPLDILMLDNHGKILQIAPKLNLSQLSEDIIPEKPIRAFLFMKGGACESLSIKPGDSVEYKIFSSPPPLLESVSKELPAAPEAIDKPPAPATQ